MVADLSQFITERIRTILCERIQMPNNVEFCLISHVVYKNGKIVPLTQTEVRIIELLAFNMGDVVSYEELIDKIWGYGEKDLVKVNISNLRRKLGIDIQSVKGIGYLVEKRPLHKEEVNTQ